MTEEPAKRRFLTIEQVAEELSVSTAQIRALLKSGDVRGIQVGGRGVWRIGTSDVEAYIEEAYGRTADNIAAGAIDETSAPYGSEDHGQ